MIICADDFGLSDDINRVIVELAEIGALSAASCMVVLDRCNVAALRPLLAHGSRVDIGLHLCFTDEGLPLTPSMAWSDPPGLPPYKVFLRRALLRQLTPEVIHRQISEQYNLFVSKAGRRPDFLDGHLHTHQLPGVRAEVVRFLQSLSKERRPYVRNTRAPIRKIRGAGLPWLKAACIGSFGVTMEKLLRAAGLATNDGFAGVYDFRQWTKYRDYLPRFGTLLPQANGILVVHPGEQEDWRRSEAEALRKLPFPPTAVNRFRRS